jgi:hypothetical protein
MQVGKEKTVMVGIQRDKPPMEFIHIAGAAASGNGAGTAAGGIPSSVVASILGGASGADAAGAAKLVGDEERGHGFVLGRALDNARPSTCDRPTRPAAEALSPAREASGPPRPVSPAEPKAPALSIDSNVLFPGGLISPPGSPTASGGFSQNKERAYQMFKEGPAKPLYSDLLALKARHKEGKAILKVLSMAWLTCCCFDLPP